MKTSIRQLLQRVALIPLSLVALMLIFADSYSRYLDAKEILEREKVAALEFLQAPAAEAIVIGNTVYLKRILQNFGNTSNRIRCIGLRDNQGEEIASQGQCPRKWPKSSVSPVYGSLETLSDVEESGQRKTRVGELLIIMNTDVFTQQIVRICLQLLMSFFTVLIVFYVVNYALNKRLVAPITRIMNVMNAVREKNYAERIEIEHANDEIGKLATDINDTIEEIGLHTAQLRDSKNEAQRALATADSAYLAKESLMQSLTKDLADPIQEVTKALTLLAMKNNDAALNEAIKMALSLAIASGSNLEDLIAIASTEQNATPNNQLSSLADLKSALSEEINGVAESINCPLHYSVVSPISKERAACIFVDIDFIKFKRLVYHLCHAVAERGSDSGLYITNHIIDIDGSSVDIVVDIRAFFSRADALTDSLRTATEGLPYFIEEKYQQIILFLSRAQGIDVSHILTERGALTVRMNLTTAYIGTADGVPPENTLNTSSLRVAVVSNDNSILNLQSRASLSQDHLRFLSPEQCDHSTPAITGPLDCVVIDIGSGAGNDFDPHRIMEIVKQNNKNVSVIFVAIVPSPQLSDRFIENLLSYGYSGVLHKPLTLANLHDEVTRLIEARHKTDHSFD